MSKPALLLDVDGVFNPWLKHHVDFCSCHKEWVRRKAWAGESRFVVNLHPLHGRMIKQLAADTGADMFWMTTWQDAANREIGPVLGLPELPVIPCPQCPRTWNGTIGGWKANHAAVWANEVRRPFVWLDDETDIPDKLASMTDVPHLVVTVDERTGLNDEHVERAREWFQQQASISSRSG